MLLSLFISGLAMAQDCDVRTLSKDLLAAGPHEAAPMFVQLASCDAKAASKVADRVIPTLIGESDGFAAANAAIEAGVLGTGGFGGAGPETSPCCHWKYRSFASRYAFAVGSVTVAMAACSFCTVF